MDKHIIEAMGKSKIEICNGKVLKVSEPKIEYCPLFHKYRGIEKLDKQSIKENIEFRISDFGMCMPNREIKMKDFLSFGISETLSTLLNENIIDCAVMVCEGCGTMIVTQSEIAQGIGGRVSGLVKTIPIEEIMKKIGKSNILDTKKATINQMNGVKLAISKGFKNIAVTIANPDDAKSIRSFESEYKKENKEANIYIFAVHTTGVSYKEAEEIFKYCDVITACASKPIREIGEKVSINKVGESIPIYAATKKGKEFLELRIEKIGRIPTKNSPKPPKPLI